MSTKTNASAAAVLSEITQSIVLTRQILRITQADLAEAVGISRTTLAKLESGDGGCSLDLFCRIAVHLGMEDQILHAMKISLNPEVARQLLNNAPQRIVNSRNRKPRQADW